MKKSADKLISMKATNPNEFPSKEKNEIQKSEYNHMFDINRNVSLMQARRWVCVCWEGLLLVVESPLFS